MGCPEAKIGRLLRCPATRVEWPTTKGPSRWAETGGPAGAPSGEPIAALQVVLKGGCVKFLGFRGDLDGEL